MATTTGYRARGVSAARRTLPLIVIMVIVLPLALVGCSADRRSSLGSSDPGAQSTSRWAEAPRYARIEYRGSLASEYDIGHKASFADAINTFLTGDEARENLLVQPMDVAVSNDGRRVFVSDLAANEVYLFDLDRRAMEQVGGRDRVWARPFGLAVDASDNLYIVEQENKTITVVGPDGRVVWQFAHRSLERPTDVAVDSQRGRIYVVDGSRQNSANHLIRVFDLKGRLIDSIGNGKGTQSGYLLFPTYITVAADGSIYVADTVNSRVVVFDAQGNFSRQIGGRGNVLGRFDKPKGVALDAEGHLYVVDSGWSNVQIFDRSGRVVMFFSSRGSAPAKMRNPTGLDIDRDGNIYVADYLNHRIDIYGIIDDAY